MLWSASKTMGILIDASSISTGNLYQRDPLDAIASLDFESIQSNEDKITSKVSALGKLISLLEKLKDETGGLRANDEDSYSYRDYELSDKQPLTVAAGAKSAIGKYEVELKSLANKHSIYSRQFPDENTIVGTGEMYLKVGENDSVTVSITDSRRTLARIHDAINVSGADVEASLLEENGKTTMILTSRESGQENRIAVQIVDGDTTHTDGKGLSALAFKSDSGSMREVKAARDSQFVVNDVFYEQSSNTATSAISDLLMKLKEGGEGTSTEIDIEQAAESILIDRLNSFADAYNKTVTQLDEYLGSRGGLRDDVAINGLQKGLEDISNWAYGNTSLRDLGVTFDSNNRISFDVNILTYNMSDDFSETAKIMTQFSDDFSSTLTDYIDDTIPDRQKEYRSDLKDTVEKENSSVRLSNAIYQYNKTSVLGIA